MRFLACHSYSLGVASILFGDLRIQPAIYQFTENCGLHPPFILWEHVAAWTNKESQVLFTSDCKMECEIDRWIGAVCSWSTAQYISRGRSLDIQRELEPLLLHTECHLIGMLFKTYPSGGISGMSNWKETTEQTQITLVIIWCGNMLGSPRITCCQSNVSGCMNI